MMSSIIWDITPCSPLKETCIMRSFITCIIKSRRIRWAGHVTRLREKKNAYRILGGKSEGKRPTGRPRRMWVDNVKMDLREIGWDGMD
jgi:hypothetical protein